MSISLEKGQRINLEKDGGGQLTSIFMGIGWDPARSGDDIDLDASVVMLDANKNEVDAVWYQKLDSSDRSIHHTGDNLTGDGDGDDEIIEVDLNRVSANVKTLVFTVTNFSGHKFRELENTYGRIVDRTNGQEIAKYVLSGEAVRNNKHTAVIIATVYRHNGGWKMRATGEFCKGKTYKKIMSTVKECAA